MRFWGGWLVGLALWSACVEPAERAPLCGPRPLAAPLFGAERPPLELMQREQNAVAALTRSSARRADVLCTGALIAPDVVLTARHCAELLPEQVAPLDAIRAHFGTSLQLDSMSVGVLGFESYDEADLAVAFLEEPVPRSVAVPLELWEAGDGAPLAVGYEAILSGYGLREDDGFGQREFLKEPIVELNAEEITVDGGGETGACVGDSGGPLLLQDEEGRHRVAGILSVGSASCVDLDVYVRLEPARAWLDSMLPDESSGCL